MNINQNLCHLIVQKKYVQGDEDAAVGIVYFTLRKLMESYMSQFEKDSNASFYVNPKTKKIYIIYTRCFISKPSWGL